MIEVEDIATLTPEIKNGKLIVTFKALSIELTDLRILHFINKIQKLVNELNNKKIKEFFFVFDIDDLIIPTNFTMLKDFAQFFKDNEDIILDKLTYSVLKSKNNIFKLFFSLFKKYYVPIKPLYLCCNQEEVDDCLFNPEKRSKFPNIINIIKETT